MPLIDELERLQALRERGALNDEEFQRAKSRLLDGKDAFDAVPTAEGSANGTLLRRLSRSRTDRWLGGVCGGLGAQTELPSWAWRLIFCLVTLYFGSGVLFYVLLWIFLPAEPGLRRE
jgi:phage shock protein PspC (stress-responsive transcriptional regulator)